jgi:hypothetical protein
MGNDLCIVLGKYCGCFFAIFNEGFLMMDSSACLCGLNFRRLRDVPRWFCHCGFQAQSMLTSTIGLIRSTGPGCAMPSRRSISYRIEFVGINQTLMKRSKLSRCGIGPVYLRWNRSMSLPFSLEGAMRENILSKVLRW